MLVLIGGGSCFAFSGCRESKNEDRKCDAVGMGWAGGFFISSSFLRLLSMDLVRLFFPKFDFWWGQNRSMWHKNPTNPMTCTALQTYTR